MNAPLLPGRIEHWPLARLRPYACNAKTHDADQVAKIAASMAEFGWTVPVLVAADGELIAGHGRILAAAQLGIAEAPVIILGHLTEAQRRAYRIADNKLPQLSVRLGSNCCRTFLPKRSPRSSRWSPTSTPCAGC